MSEDSAIVLSDFVSSVENLPSEIQHILMEISHKDQNIMDLRNKCEAREISIARFHKVNGLLVSNPKEGPAMQKLQADYVKIKQISDEKVRLAERAVTLLTRHCNRFDRELSKVQGGGMPLYTPTIALPPTPVAPMSPYSSTIVAASTGAGPMANMISYAPPYVTGPNDRNLKRKYAPSALPPPAPPPLNLPTPALPAISSPLPTPTLPASLSPSAQAPPTRPARPSRLSTSFIHNADSPVPSDTESRASTDASKPLKRSNKRFRPSAVPRRLHSPDDDEDAEGEEDDGEEASLENPDYSGGAADDGALYCYCQRVSFGQMVGCDNANCPYEWFHFECAGLKTQPEGAWYCRECSETMAKESAGGSRRRR